MGIVGKPKSKRPQHHITGQILWSFETKKTREMYATFPIGYAGETGLRWHRDEVLSMFMHALLQRGKLPWQVTRLIVLHKDTIRDLFLQPDTSSDKEVYELSSKSSGRHNEDVNSKRSRSRSPKRLEKANNRFPNSVCILVASIFSFWRYDWSRLVMTLESFVDEGIVTTEDVFKSFSEHSRAAGAPKSWTDRLFITSAGDMNTTSSSLSGIVYPPYLNWNSALSNEIMESLLGARGVDRIERNIRLSENGFATGAQQLAKRELEQAQRQHFAAIQAVAVGLAEAFDHLQSQEDSATVTGSQKESQFASAVLSRCYGAALRRYATPLGKAAKADLIMMPETTQWHGLVRNLFLKDAFFG